MSLLTKTLEESGMKIWETSAYEMYEEFKWWRAHGGKSVWEKLDKVEGVLYHNLGKTNRSGKDENHFWQCIGDYVYRKGKLYGGASGEKAEEVTRYMEASRLYERSKKGEYVIFLGNKNHRYEKEEA